jgi:plastocyanin
MKPTRAIGLIVLSVIACLPPSAWAQERGTLEGQVTYSGEVPKADVLDEAGRRRDLLQVDRRTKGVRDVMVSLLAPPSEPGDRKTETVDQFEHRFVPHVIAIRAGQGIRFTNSDAANHNVRASSLEARNSFNIYTGIGGHYEHRFVAQPTLHPVRLGCDIHPWMSAWIFVFDHPYFAVTDEDGRFRIPDIPAGNYQLLVRQADVGYQRRIDLAIEAGKATTSTIQFTRDDLK